LPLFKKFLLISLSVVMDHFNMIDLAWERNTYFSFAHFRLQLGYIFILCNYLINKNILCYKKTIMFGKVLHMLAIWHDSLPYKVNAKWLPHYPHKVSMILCIYIYMYTLTLFSQSTCKINEILYRKLNFLGLRLCGIG
jgi:hypothetical protein